MNEIVSSVQRVTDIIAEISAATTEQSQGIEQVNVAVNQLDTMTQQNAALVEQSAAAASSLKDQTIKLNQSVSKFSVDGNDSAASAYVAVAKHVAPAATFKAGSAVKPFVRKPAAPTSAAKPVRHRRLSQRPRRRQRQAQPAPAPSQSLRHQRLCPQRSLHLH